ncbi:MAG: hypothetical protein JEY79_09005 [Pseudodesulfovibrio sp.]|nr:hypothetical protein [Pseudodesulfovibrio sp.]
MISLPPAVALYLNHTKERHKFKHFILIIIALTLLTACSSRSGRPEIKRPSLDSRLYTLKHRLNLTDAQLETIRPIIKENHEKKSALFKDSEKNDKKAVSAMRQQIEDLEWKTYKNLSEHLTTEQMEKYSKLLKEKEERMKEQMKTSGKGRPERDGKKPGGR